MRFLASFPSLPPPSINDERPLEKSPDSLRWLSTLGNPCLDGRSVEVRLLRHGIVPTQLLLRVVSYSVRREIKRMEVR